VPDPHAPAEDEPVRLSVLIPARNEEGCIGRTVDELYRTLRSRGISHEILVVNDHSTDGTPDVLASLRPSVPTLRWIDNPSPKGFGHAVRAGLDSFRGDAVAICMADGSDPPGDLALFFREMESKGSDCVFGSRFTPRRQLTGYPPLKLHFNRIANAGIRFLFGFPYDDLTNAFKLYQRHVVAGVIPLRSGGFELTVELPLKAIVRGYSYSVVPNGWVRRKSGFSKFRILGSAPRYLLATFRCLPESRAARPAGRESLR
jgi:dolichol-phosphate mannosyltransferase